MVSAIKQVVHNVKQGASERKQQVDVNRADAQFVNDVLTSMNFKENSARELIMQVDTIRDVIQVTEGHNIRCFYALHAIFLALLSVDCTDVLNEMSDVDIRVLAKCISVAKSRPCPDKNALEQSLNSLQNKGYVPSSPDGISKAAYVNSNKIMHHVADLWDDAVAELNRWGDAIDNFERVVSVKQKWVSMKELAELLGFKKMKKFYGFKRDLGRKHPEIENWFENYGNQGKLFNMEHFDQLKKWADEKRNKDAKAEVQEGNWTILELADKIGVTGETENKKRKRLFGLKCRLKKHFPVIADYFTPDGQYFKADCFEDFKALIEKYRSQKVEKAHQVAQVAKLESESLWAMETLAAVLKMNKHTLATVKWQLKHDNPDLVETIDSWFISSKDTNGKVIHLFKAEYLDEMKTLIAKGKKRASKQSISKVVRGDKKSANKKKIDVDDAEIKAALDAVLVKTDADATAVVQNPKPVESKMTLTDVIALNKMLARWQEMLEAALKEQAVAEQAYNDALAKLTHAEPQQRAELLSQMQAANDGVRVAAARIAELKARVDDADKLAQERAEALNAVRLAAEAKQNAERALAEKDAAIAKFVKKIGTIAKVL